MGRFNEFPMCTHLCMAFLQHWKISQRFSIPFPDLLLLDKLLSKVSVDDAAAGPDRSQRVEQLNELAEVSIQLNLINTILVCPKYLSVIVKLLSSPYIYC